MEDPELQARLQQLDHELEEGEITTKGYQKRRTMLLSQYLGPSAMGQPTVVNSDVRLSHSPHDSVSNQYIRSPSMLSSAGNFDGWQRLDTMTSASTPVEPDYGSGGGLAGYAPAIPQHMRNSSSTTSYLSPHSRQASLTIPPQTMHSRNASGASALSGNQSYGYNLSPSSPHYEYYDGRRRSTLGNPGQESDSQIPSLDGPRDVYYDPTATFSDFPTQGYDPARDSSQLGVGNGDYGQQMPHRYPSGEGIPFSPTASMAPPMLSANDLPPIVNHQSPLEPRDVPFAIYDPHDQSTPMSRFDNIAAVLRHRAKTCPKLPAYMVLDSKGKEFATCTWEKLASRAEKVAQVIRDKSNLYGGDRVALLYRDMEIIDFVVALFGCFIAGVVAVPINALDDYPKLNYILTNTQTHLALTTDYNLKAFQRDLVAQKLNWPRGVEWWKTNEFGAFNPKKKEDYPALQTPDLAYIEFSRAPTGDLRGVVLSHRTIMHQMGCLSAMISTAPTAQKDTFSPFLKDKAGKPINFQSSREVLVSYLDPRQQIGMIFAALLNVYGGHTTVWCPQSIVSIPGLYANVLTRYKATLTLADYPGLKTVAYNYQQDPFATRNFVKKTPVDFHNIRLCMIDCLTVDAEFHEILADRWLRPLGNLRPREAVAPMLCLPEHCGMVIAMRDWLGGEENMGVPLKLDLQADKGENKSDDDSSGSESKGKEKTGAVKYASLIGGITLRDGQNTGKESELGEVLLDKEALKTNDVIVVATGEDARKRAGEAGTVRVGAFGYPIPDATLAIVDPGTSLLCTPNVIGEIWVDSPSLSGGFWALPKHTESIFHARAYKFEEGNPNPMPVEPEFLRTGLLGCVIEGKIYVLGLYEDRLRQKVEWVENVGGIWEELNPPEYRYFFVQHLIVSIMRNIPKIFDSSAFDVLVNNEHLPIVLLESYSASTSPQSAGGPPRQLDTAMLDSLSERCMEILLEEHHLRVYCVMITAPNTLPRVWKNGRKEIGNMLCRKEFDAGTLPCVHVKFGVERAVLNLPIGVDPVGGIWSPIATQNRQEILMLQEKQYSGVDYREVVIDDRTSTPLNHFSSIVDLLQWRVMRQAEEPAYSTIDGKGKEGKGANWKKLDMKIAAVAQMIKNKWKIQSGDHVICMYTHSEDYVFAIHACLCLGVVAIPAAPLDQNRLHEDCPALLHMVKDFEVKAILVNNEVDHLLKLKPVSQQLKHTSALLRAAMPVIHNTSKPPKTSVGCRDLGLTMKQLWVDPAYTALVWTYWTADQRRIAVSLNHITIMGMCKVQKETCQMTSSRPILGCVRSTSGLGFIHTCLMGIYVGAPTYLVSPVDFAQNPFSLFLTLSRYKVKDTYATPQMLDHAIATMPPKGFTLHELKNLMISFEGRPRPDIFQRVRLHFASAGLDRTAINTIYSHVLNPMVASRSYMCIEPIELWLDPKALRAGLVYQVDPETYPNALLVQDSGMVPVSTQVAIVNPETRRLCHTGEYGEIWVDSEASVKSFYRSSDSFDKNRFLGKTVDGDSRNTYVRTGDLGFLHTVNRPNGPGNAMVEMQVLFVLGGIGETFEVNGLNHFPIDIEATVERSHQNIVPGGSAIFQAGGLVVVLVEVLKKAYLASMVPVTVNAILDEHQLVADIVAFVGAGDFPRSRLGEKQRGKILSSWVSRRMKTIAQFGIRDTENDRSASTQGPTARDSIQIQPTILETPTQISPQGPSFTVGHVLPSDAPNPQTSPQLVSHELDAPTSFSTPTGLPTIEAHFLTSPIEMPASFGEFTEKSEVSSSTLRPEKESTAEPQTPTDASQGLRNGKGIYKEYQDMGAFYPPRGGINNTHYNSEDEGTTRVLRESNRDSEQFELPSEALLQLKFVDEDPGMRSQQQKQPPTPGIDPALGRAL